MALSAGRNTAELLLNGQSIVLPVAAGAVIFDGSLVVLNATGYAEAATKAEGLTAAGRAEEYVDNRNGVDGDLTVKVKRGAFVWDNTITEANKVKPEHVLKDCYIEDDCTVTALATGSSRAGKVLAVSDDGSVTVETL
ncbi:hypothetical protein [Ruminiclostridium papyrosolvens]|uniref:Uncharacterized protein n=1 Tax=Ruminiclostridium papyrosolvens C7 TaxID=1330534 RepID=U4QXM9_9FIRM|nr:hypothetical protein [Ruminiclostridium papyrosolvens]EPR07667.1 hypothetical protein L323_19915 [Ruminiclostridium papyrosolvens C7]